MMIESSILSSFDQVVSESTVTAGLQAAPFTHPPTPTSLPFSGTCFGDSFPVALGCVPPCGNGASVPPRRNTA